MGSLNSWINFYYFFFLHVLSHGSTCNVESGDAVVQQHPQTFTLPYGGYLASTISTSVTYWPQSLLHPLGIANWRTPQVIFLYQVGRQNIYNDTEENGCVFAKEILNYTQLSVSQFSELVLTFFTVSEKKGLVMFYQYQNVTSANPIFL